MKKLVYWSAVVTFVLEWINLITMLFAFAFNYHKLFVINLEIFGALTFLLIMLMSWMVTFKEFWLGVKKVFHNCNEVLKNLYDEKLY